MEEQQQECRRWEAEGEGSALTQQSGACTEPTPPAERRAPKEVTKVGTKRGESPRLRDTACEV